MVGLIFSGVLFQAGISPSRTTGSEFVTFRMRNNRKFFGKKYVRRKRRASDEKCAHRDNSDFYFSGSRTSLRAENNNIFVITKLIREHDGGEQLSVRCYVIRARVRGPVGPHVECLRYEDTNDDKNRCRTPKNNNNNITTQW